MTEILERMLTMGIADMEKSERDLCKHLTHLALVIMKQATDDGTIKSKKKRGGRAGRQPTIRFVDTAAAAGDDDDDNDAEVHDDAAKEAEDSNLQPKNTPRTTAAGASAAAEERVTGHGRSEAALEVALEALTKAVKVSTDGIQVLLPGGQKQTNLQTSEAAIKSWRYQEIGTYTVLSELYTQLHLRGNASGKCVCIICSKETRGNDQLQFHEAADRRACALREMQKKKNELFDNSNRATTEATARMDKVLKKIQDLSDDAALDRQWCAVVVQTAKKLETTEIPRVTKGSWAERGTGLAGVLGTENSALVEALLPLKSKYSVEKNELR